MGVYIYKISDRKTGEVLFTGRQSECGEYLGCGAKTILRLASRETHAEKNTKYAQYTVTREWKDEIPVCVDCGTEMPGAVPIRHRCPDCARKRKNEKTAKWNREHRAGERIPDDPAALSRAACVGCRYWGGESYISGTCNYIFIKGHSRGCPPGTGCNVREERRKPRRL